MLLERQLLRSVHCVLQIVSFFVQLVVSWSVTLTCFIGSLLRLLLPRRLGAESMSPCLRKLPKHLACLILENNFSYSDIANLILWSAEAGIAYISVYDHNGSIKNNSKILENFIRDREQDHIKKPLYFHSQCPYIEDVNTGVNNMCVRVAVISSEDGRSDLMEVTKHLSNRINSQQWQLHDVIPSNVDKLIKERHNFPDPDLILRFGSVSSLMGYLPWQIRLTEILSLPSHHGISQRSFHRALVKFASLQQRFGK